MPTSPALIARSIHAAALVSPALAGGLAYRAFFTTAPRMNVHARDAATHAVARRGHLRVGGNEIATYEWGRGERAVLLMHGWQGRASQFSPLVRELVFEGFRVFSFDAPAHGSSRGRHTDIRDWVTAAEQLQATDGPFHAIVGHSLGALAALTAARSTVPVRAVATIAGAAGPIRYTAEFSRQLALSPATSEHLERRFRARFKVDYATFAARYDAALHPLPAGTELLVVHDRGDRRMPDQESLRLHSAHGERSRLLRTQGFGHSRVLQADATLDAAVALISDGLSAVDKLGTTTARDDVHSRR